MSFYLHRIAGRAPVARSVAVAALLGATMLAAPLASALAASPPTQATAQPAATTASASHQETVEQRITSLHKSLKITPAEEADWNAVAQAMRDSAATMDKLVDERNAAASQNMTAVDDLAAYQKFAQAHVDGLNTLIPAFTTLYNSMPDAQKKVADQVFSNVRRHVGQAHS